MSLYGHIFALIYDPLLALSERGGMRAIRRKALASAHGRTLEIGAGTGLNLALYPPAVTRLDLVDPEAPMVRRLHRRSRLLDRPVEVVQAPAEALPFDRASFDTVVSTLVLCTVADPSASLREIGRVLTPGGQLLLVEHVYAQQPRLARWQERLHKPWQHLAYGCHCNRDTLAALREAGFETTGLERNRWPRMPPIVQPLILGSTRIATGSTT